MHSRENLDKGFLDNIHGVVEATDCERHLLWEKYHERKKWEENLSGHGAHIGDIDGRPIWVSLLTAVIDGKKILFWHVTSKVADYDQVDTWIETALADVPSAWEIRGPDNRALNRADANNFTNVF
jgi:hypothetical protein